MLHDCRFALVAVLVVLRLLVTVFVNACVPNCSFGQCLCFLVSVLVGACVRLLQFLSVLVFPRFRFGRPLCSLVVVFA